MSEEVRLQRLTVAMKAISIIFIVGFLPVFVLAVLDSPIVAQGSLIASLFRWQPYNVAYFGMLVTIFIVWGIFLWKASRNPKEQRLFIDFTIWASLAHAVFMLVFAIYLEGELIHVVGDVAVLALIAAVLYWLRPRPVAKMSEV